MEKLQSWCVKSKNKKERLAYIRCYVAILQRVVQLHQTVFGFFNLPWTILYDLNSWINSFEFVLNWYYKLITHQYHTDWKKVLQILLRNKVLEAECTPFTFTLKHTIWNQIYISHNYPNSANIFINTNNITVFINTDNTVSAIQTVK